MSKVPKNLQNDSTSEYLLKNGLIRMHQGKVRDTYFLDDSLLLVVASDRISIFDFVLNALVPNKGAVLTALTNFWLTEVLSSFSHHLVRSLFFPELNAVHDLKNYRFNELSIKQCLVVKNMYEQIQPYEMIFRHHIGGSVFKEYQKTGKAGGHILLPNLPKWSKLEKPIFTPSTKEEVGHDVNVNTEYYFMSMKVKGLEKTAYEIVEILSKAYSIAYAFAKEKDILIVDTKFEVANHMIIDEILTPDSSRFVLKTDWEKAMQEGREPQFLDKEPVRIWGRTIKTPFFDDAGKQIIGINNLNPENLEHVEFVHSLKVPEQIISDTTSRYLKLFEMIVGKSLFNYQTQSMCV